MGNIQSSIQGPSEQNKNPHHQSQQNQQLDREPEQVYYNVIGDSRISNNRSILNDLNTSHSSSASRKRKESDFQLVKQLKDDRYGQVKVMQNLVTKEMLAIRTVNFHDQYDFQNFEKLCILHKNTYIPNIVKVVDYLIKQDEALCSSTYTITVIYEYIDNDLRHEFNQMIDQKLQYSENEIFQIIENVVQGINSLVKQNGFHGDVQPRMVLRTSDEYKLTDARFMNSNGNAYQQLFLGNRGPESCYIAPELFNGLKNEQLNPQHDPIKCDIFSAGLTALQATILSEVSVIYDFQEIQFKSRELMKLLQKATQKYSPQLVNVLRGMLAQSTSERMSIDEILSHCALHRKQNPQKQTSDLSALQQKKTGQITPDPRSTPQSQSDLKATQIVIPEQFDEQGSPARKHEGLSSRNTFGLQEQNNLQNIENLEKKPDYNSQKGEDNSDRKSVNDSQYRSASNLEQSLMEIERKIQDALQVSKQTQRRFELSPVRQFRDEILNDDIYVPLNTSTEFKENAAPLERSNSYQNTANSFYGNNQYGYNQNNNGSQIAPSQNSRTSNISKNSNQSIHNKSQKKEWVKY